jgi:glutamate-1-semialdehyde 2,1-aminomutase
MPNRVALDQDYPNISASQALWKRAANLIPAGTQTLAKGPSQYVDGVAPKYLARGKGARVWDVDGNEYVDLSMAVGPLVLGYGHPAVDRAISEQLQRGITFSLMHPLEVEVAELVRRVVPGADSVRFSKTGCDVTTAAVRLARAFTGRDKVLCCGYHGWHDWFIGTTSRNAGVTLATRAATEAFPYNDLFSLMEVLNEEVACVILEPTVFDAPDPEYLRVLKRACEAVGALLIFDEMWTGFRISLGGAQQHYDVTADLACFSKAIANGMPLSALTGRADVMRLLEEDVFFFTTFGGEALSLAAAKVTIEELRDLEVPRRLEYAGKQLQEGYDHLAFKKGLSSKVIGLPSRSLVTFDAEAGDPLLQKSLVQQELLRHGVLWTGFHNLCLAHDEAEIDHVLKAYDRALDALSTALAKGRLSESLRGKPVRAVFRKTR